MKNILSYLLACGFLVSISSCENFFETTLELDPPTFEKKIVVSAFAKAGDTSINIMVTENFGILDNTKTPVLVNPQLSCKIDGITQTKVNYDKKSFNVKLDKPLEAGQICELKVTHTGFPDVQASQTVPALVELKKLKFVEEGGLDPNGNKQSKIEIQFDDPVGKNYYGAVVYIKYNKQEMFYPTQTSVIDQGSISEVNGSGVIINDLSFDGKRKELDLLIRRFYLDETKSNIKVEWINLTEEDFKFKKSNQQYSKSSDNPFATPADVYTNINGGLGFFLLSNSKTYTVE
jgi:hypothetical protein